MICNLLCSSGIVIKFLSRISQITPSIQSPPFLAGRTPHRRLTSLLQATLTPSTPQSLPALRQGKHRPLHLRHSKPAISRRRRRRIPDRKPNIPPKLLLFDFVLFRRAADHGVARRVGGLAVKSVGIVTEEAPVEKNGGGEGGEAAGEFRAAGGVAEEAVGVGEVIEALSQAVHGCRGINKVGAPMVGRYLLRKTLHFFDESWDKARVLPRFPAAAVEASLSRSGIGDGGGENGEEEEDPCQDFGKHDSFC